MKVAIAGASGFIGSSIIEKLLLDSSISVVGLSRSDKESDNPNLRWKKCDLFSVLDIEQVIEGADVLIYLVHSMQASAKLDQANFRDYDLILADNFGRAARKLEINKVIYLGGIIPQSDSLSPHLLSRLEVELCLKEYISEYVFFRAGLILGKGGSSFHLLTNLIKNLKILIFPKWTKNQTSPVYIDQVADTFYSVIKNNRIDGSVYDLTSSDSITYMDLLKKVAKLSGLKRMYFYIGVSFITISRFWVALFSGAPRNLAYPLVESLKYSMIPREDHRYISDDVKVYSVDEALAKSIEESKGYEYNFGAHDFERKSVRSVQRFKVKNKISAKEVTDLYMKWMPKFLYPFILVEVQGRWVSFSLFSKKFKILILRLSTDRSTEDRQILYIKGGILAAKQDRGRLEFREVLDGKYILVAIHDFYPSLPWYIYIFTQAKLHLIVMTRFGKYLKRKSL